jgi:hypothetical protein
MSLRPEGVIERHVLLERVHWRPEISVVRHGTQTAVRAAPAADDRAVVVDALPYGSAYDASSYDRVTLACDSNSKACSYDWRLNPSSRSPKGTLTRQGPCSLALVDIDAWTA